MSLFSYARPKALGEALKLLKNGTVALGRRLLAQGRRPLLRGRWREPLSRDRWRERVLDGVAVRSRACAHRLRRRGRDRVEPGPPAHTFEHPLHRADGEAAQGARDPTR